jgi:hypothetical protein
MGLLGKANAKSDTDIGIQAFINSFHEKNPLFHCLLMKPQSGEKRGLLEIAAMSGSHGIAYTCLPSGDCLLLLPGGLDLDLFSHRISKSSGSTVIMQFSADSPSLAFEKLSVSSEQ